MSQTTVTVPAFDATTRAPFYQLLVVLNNAVDPATGINVGTPDTTTPLDFSVNIISGSSTPPVVFTQVGLVPDGQANAGARIIKIAPGILQVTDPPSNWQATCKVHGAPSSSSSIVFGGNTPPPPNLAGVQPVSAVLTTQP